MSIDLNNNYHTKVLSTVKDNCYTDEKQDSVQQDNTIECVNFAMDDSVIRFKGLMSNLVYSPNARFAVNIVASGQKVTSVFILDPFNMKFYQYRNCSDMDLKMNLLYWYSEDCLVFIHIDIYTSRLHQTPVFLNHQAKTYEAREAVVYPVPYTISFKETSREVQSFEMEGKKYVLLISVNPENRDIYAISHKPDSSSPLKKFAMWNKVEFPQTAFVEKVDALLEDRINEFLVSTQAILINNEIHLPLRFHCKQNRFDVRRRDISELLGLFIKVKFADMAEIPTDATYRDKINYIVSIYQNEHATVWQYVMPNVKVATKDEYVKRPGIYRNVNDNLVFVSEEKKSEENVITVTYIDRSKLIVSTIHKEVYYKNSEVAVCSTPFNILIAKKISLTRISCKTIPYPFNKQKFPTLQEMILSKTYLNMDGKQEFAHTFTI